MAEPNPQQLQQAAQHLLQNPLTCLEQNAEIFALIRKHEQTLDRWFTQRLGYRLQVTSTTARLYKTTVIPHRPVLVAPVGSKRALSQRECTLLVLTLAAVAAGPRVISLRDLIDDVRSQATDAEITLTNEPVERRALVTALKWMIVHGLAKELHETIDRYEHDDTADAILEIDFDRVSLLPLPVLGRAETALKLLDRTDKRTNTRQWMRARLVEDPVLYQSDIEEHEWSELRRRVGEEIALLDEMFGLRLEVRAEGMAAIDPRGRLTDRSFPSSGTTGHAALVFIEWLHALPEQCCSSSDALQAVEQFCQRYQKHWSKQMLQQPATLLAEVVSLLSDLRLLAVVDEKFQLLEAAARYRVSVEQSAGASASIGSEASTYELASDESPQSSLW